LVERVDDRLRRGAIEPEFGRVSLFGGGRGHLLDADDDLHARAALPARTRSRTPARCRSWRPITRRWICCVPSYSWVIFASRIIRSTGYSVMYPYPPNIWTASLVTRIALSPAISLAALVQYGRSAARACTRAAAA